MPRATRFDVRVERWQARGSPLDAKRVGTGPQFAGPLGITADDVTVHCDYIGGGFGSKFAADTWGVACAELSKKTGRPVKLMLDRDQELKIAGNRPSGFLKCRVGADKNGVITVWDSEQWGTAGAKPGVVSEKVVPYVYEPKNRRVISHTIKTNRGLVRAWRAPNHPQACAMSQTAIDDIAAKLGLNSLDVFKRNLVHVANGKAEFYALRGRRGSPDRLERQLASPRQSPKKGSIVEGLGLAIHTWGGAVTRRSVRSVSRPMAVCRARSAVRTWVSVPARPLPRWSPRRLA